MKTILKDHLSLFLIVTLSIILSSYKPCTDCGSDAFIDKCAPSLGDYTFIKTFNIQVDKADGKFEFSYVLSKGSNYRIVICDQNSEGNKMIVNFYDRNKKLIASNYLKNSKKFFPSLNYTCSATGVYYIEASFENGKSGCGANILGFK
ncbi:MAG: hypothetical protein ACXVPN_11165 [Bacteroidia bacterium]